MALDMTTALTINAKVTGQQQITGLSKGLTGVGTASKQGAAGMAVMRGAASGLMAALGPLLPLLAVGAIGKFATDNLNAADAMSKLSQRTGVAAPELDKFRKVAELSDTSIESLSKAFPTLAKNVTDAANGTGPAADAFAQLGIKLTDTSGKVRDTDAVMKDIMDKFKKMEDGTQKAALASEIFGKRLGSELIPFLNSGSQAVNEMSTALTQEFADKAAAFNDKIENMTEKLGNLGIEVMTAVMPVLDQLVDMLGDLVNQLVNDEGFKAFITGIVDIAQRIAQVLLPALKTAAEVLQQIFAFFANLPPGLQDFLLNMAALGVSLQTVSGVLGPIISTITSGLIPAIVALGKVLLATLVTPPIGFVTLLVAAGVAIYTFRDQIGDAFKAIGELFVDLAKEFNEFVVKPITNATKAVVRAITDAFKGLANALRGPFDAIGRFIKSIFNGYIGLVEKFINGAISGINKLVAGANRALSALKLPNIPTVSEVQLPRFAAGGVVDKPTVALVGEGREREYIVPESKFARSALNFLMGKRGDAVLRNEGGRTGRAGASQGNTTIQLNTGPVLQQDGQRYVTIEDLERSLQSLAANLLGNSRSYAGRRYQGLA
jgi:phage-related protein